MNAGLGQLDHWNEDAIRARAANLAAAALKVWSAPELLPKSLLPIIQAGSEPPLIRLRTTHTCEQRICENYLRLFAEKCSLSIPASQRSS